jgi:N-acetylglucosamine transport system substrate-binding protein
MSIPNQYSRRLFLQRAILASVAAAGGGSLLAGCASGGDDTNTEGGETSAENPFGVKADAPLDVVIFKGGYGDDYAKFHESLYKKKFSAAEIKHAGITDIRQQLQPRFNSGNPPDVIDNSGAEQLPLASWPTSPRCSTPSRSTAARSGTPSTRWPSRPATTAARSWS